MNPGSEPERDDTGLPPVDIEIPDDARELDRDVQAYYRELRALRRHQRRTRWHRSLGTDGVVLPLLACCLILALITGTLLTVFTATSDQNPGLSGTATASLAPASRGQPTSRIGSRTTTAGPTPRIVVAGLLPRALIAVDGKAPVPLEVLRRAMLVLVPQRCACGSTLAWLADVAASAHAAAYLIYNQQTRAEVRQLYQQLDSRRQAALTLAADASNVLTSPARYPPGIPAAQLTAILVAPDGTATYAGGLSPRESQAALIQAIID